MKEFEKWNKIHRINDLRLKDKVAVEHNEQERNKGWKAALEWALRDLNEQFEHYCHGDSGWQGKFIEQELKL